MRRILLLLAGLAVCALAQTPAPKPYFTVHELAPGVYAAIVVPGSGAGSNAGFVIGERAVAVVDTFQNVDAARALLAEIRRHTALPVRYVINTHYHVDHVTGNQVFADAGATVMAQRNVRAWIHTENLKFFGAHPSEAQRAMVAAYHAPDLVYDDGVDLYLGGRHVVVRVFPGHTGGDSAVLLPLAHVVFTGDLFWCHSLPNLIDASTGPLLETLSRLVAWPQSAEATFVPGHGPLGHAADVVAFQGYLKTMRADVAGARGRGLTGDKLVAAVLPELKADYGSWGGYAHFGPRNLLDTDAELAGRKHIPQSAGGSAGEAQLRP